MHFTFAIALAFLAPVLAAALARDPVSIYAPESSSAAEDYTLQTIPDDACAEICGLHHILGAITERDALCSGQGLSSTLECALCIDTTWPETTWEDSALAEYERIVENCHAAEQMERDI